MSFVNLFVLIGLAMLCYTFVFGRVSKKDGDISEKELVFLCAGLICDLVRVRHTIHNYNHGGYTFFGISGLIVSGLVIYSGVLFLQKIVYEDKGSADLDRVKNMFSLTYVSWWLVLTLNFANLIR